MHNCELFASSKLVREFKQMSRQTSIGAQRQHPRWVAFGLLSLRFSRALAAVPFFAERSAQIERLRFLFLALAAVGGAVSQRFGRIGCHQL